jgi:acyl dehydratase
MTRLQPGLELPTREITVTLRQLVRYAGASGDLYQMHYDLDFAHDLGHRELSVHGLLKAALLGRLLRDWLQPEERLRTFAVSYRGLDFRDEPMRLGGRVASVLGTTAHLDLWIDSADGTRSTYGTAEVEVSA